jgi:hypothetical protein
LSCEPCSKKITVDVCYLLSTNVDGLFVDGSKMLDGTKGRLMSNRDTVLVLLGVM